MNNLIAKILKNRVLTHILYWLALVILAIVYGLGYNQPILVSLILKFIILPVQILATYLFMYWQFPLLAKRRYWAFAAAVFFPTYFLYALLHINNDFGLGLFLSSWHKPHSLYSILTDLELYFRYMVDIYMVVFISMGIKLSKQQLEAREEMQMIEAEKAKAEYDFIQARLQPAFLLNSLKLIEQKSANFDINTPEVIADLADVLDYTLYQSDQKSIVISEEIEKLHTFLKMYDTSSDQMTTFEIQQLVENDHAQIVPLTLINFVQAKIQEIENSYSSPYRLVLNLRADSKSCDLVGDFHIEDDMSSKLNVKLNLVL